MNTQTGNTNDGCHGCLAHIHRYRKTISRMHTLNENIILIKNFFSFAPLSLNSLPLFTIIIIHFSYMSEWERYYINVFLIKLIVKVWCALSVFVQCHFDRKMFHFASLLCCSRFGVLYFSTNWKEYENNKFYWREGKVMKMTSESNFILINNIIGYYGVSALPHSEREVECGRDGKGKERSCM